MSFDGDGDREEDDVRTLCTYIIPPVFTDAFMQTLKDKKKKHVLSWRELNLHPPSL